jgi:protein-tyrosine-phosphatase
VPAVLFVCTANQCRSPMAEALFQERLREMGLDSEWDVVSAGTSAFGGSPPTHFARQAMKERGLDLSDHRSKPVSAAMLQEVDLVLVMEARHKSQLRSRFPHEAKKVHLLTEMVGEKRDIDDPVLGHLERYQETAEELDRILERGTKRIVKLAGGKMPRRR